MLLTHVLRWCVCLCERVCVRGQLLADLSSKCPKTNLTECEMEWYRNRTIGETCGNSCPSHQADGTSTQHTTYTVSADCP